MKYHVTLGSHETTPVAVEVHDLPNGKLEVDVGGRRIEVDVEVVGPQLSFLIGGAVVDLTTEGSPPDIGVIASGRRAYVRVESERQRAADAARSSGRATSDKVATSPMPGRVVKVLVKNGDVVEQGQPLVVMEAMKMENEIRARSAGTVSAVHVAVGSAVDGNAKLVTLS